MTKLGYILSAVALVAIGVIIGVYGASLVNSGSYGAGVGGSVDYQAKTFVGDVYSGMSQTKVLSGGNIVGPIVTGANALTVGTGGTAINLFKCASKAYDPGSFSSSTVASTSVALSGVVAGNLVFASFDAATSSEQWRPVANVLSSGNVVVNLVAIPGTAAWNAGLDITTSTLKACVLN